MKYLPEGKAILTGSPIREELSKGDKIAALKMCNFSANLPVILVIGGSLGANAINSAIRQVLPKLLPDFQVVHICGKEKIDNLLLNTSGYKQFEYVKAELKDLFAMADLVISRAGANAICELLALKIPNLLIPLPAKSSRGDQILNAESFEAQGYSMILKEDELDESTLLDKIHELYFTKDTYINNMNKSVVHDSIRTITNLIEETVAEKETAD